MKTYAGIINNFLHDMATGTWAACLLVIHLLAARRPSLIADASLVIRDASREVFWLMIIALLIVTITGASRLFYWRRMTPKDQVAVKRRALLWKHIMFIVVYGGGTYWGWTLIQ